MGLGQELTGFDIRVSRVRFSRISGSVRDLDGSIPRGDLSLRERDFSRDSILDVVASATLDDSGRFTLTGVGPGQYTLIVRHKPSDDRVPAATRWALQQIDVTGADLDGLELTLQEGLEVSGRVVSDTGVLPEFNGGIVFVPTAESRFLAELTLGHIGIERDGRFSGRLMPGRYDIQFRSNVQDLRLASAMFNGVDALDSQLTISPGDTVRGLLTLTDRETELSGRLLAGSDLSMSAFSVIVLATDERYWTPNNRRNQVTTPSADGTFAFRSLPAGTYRLAAVTDFDPVEGIDSELLRRLAATSPVLITLNAGDKKTQDLRVK